MASEWAPYVVYVDESGDHSLDSINPEYPVFVLAFCVFKKIDYCKLVAPRVTAFKFVQFGHDQVVLHEREIRQKSGPFRVLNDRQRESSFYDGLNSLMEKAPFTLIAAVIDKGKHADQYNSPDSPYDLALTFCMERLHMHLRAERRTHVIVESRGKKEDAELELVFRRICDGASRIGVPIPYEIVFADKKANAPGLQLADLVARPIGRHVMNPAQENRAWDILEKKFRRSPGGKIEGWGLKCFP